MCPMSPMDSYFVCNFFLNFVFQFPKQQKNFYWNGMNRTKHQWLWQKISKCLSLKCKKLPQINATRPIIWVRTVFFKWPDQLYIINNSNEFILKNSKALWNTINGYWPQSGLFSILEESSRYTFHYRKSWLLLIGQLRALTKMGRYWWLSY